VPNYVSQGYIATWLPDHTQIEGEFNCFVYPLMDTEQQIDTALLPSTSNSYSPKWPFTVATTANYLRISFATLTLTLTPATTTHGLARPPQATTTSQRHQILVTTPLVATMPASQPQTAATPTDQETTMNLSNLKIINTCGSLKNTVAHHHLLPQLPLQVLPTYKMTPTAG
jgi:hypothetical protein